MRSPRMLRKLWSFNALLVILMIVIVVTFLVSVIDWKDETYPQRKCYEYKSKRMSYSTEEEHWFLEDILKAHRQPQPERTIFFHVTNCLNISIELSNRQACAIESAAKLNPKWDIFVLFASPVAFSFNVSLAIRNLMTYPNIYWRNVDIWAYGHDTPAQEWIYDKNQLMKSKYLIPNVSNYLRLVSLFRYGGTHLDLDFIMKKSISNLEPNYACAETNKSINNALLNSDHRGTGHEIIKLFLQNFVSNYNGNIWANNGPVVITRVLRSVCGTQNISEIQRNVCNFTILPQQAFYAIGLGIYKQLFEPKYASRAARITNDSIAVHFWNKLSHVEKLRIRSGKPSYYEILAKEYCPRVYESLDEFL